MGAGYSENEPIEILIGCYGWLGLEGAFDLFRSNIRKERYYTRFKANTIFISAYSFTSVFQSFSFQFVSVQVLGS